MMIIIIAGSQMKSMKEKTIQTLSRSVSELVSEHKSQFFFLPSMVTHSLRATYCVVNALCLLLTAEGCTLQLYMTGIGAV